MEKNIDSKKNVVIELIKNKSSESPDINYRKIKFRNSYIYIVFNEATASSDTISDFIIRSIESINFYEDDELEIKKENAKKRWQTYKNKVQTGNTLSSVLQNIEEKISINSVKKLDYKKDDLFFYLFSGFSLVIYEEEILALETKKPLDRAISEPVTENNIRGPKDAFNENYMTNIGLIRKRIKTEKLILKEQKLGRRTKTKVGILYMEDVAKKYIVDYVEERLKKIDIDGILDSNYIVEILENGEKTGFPTMISTEKPDLVSFYLLQGRIAIVVENTPFVIVIPAFLKDFINNIDDKYIKNTKISLTRIIRYIAFILTIFTPAVYVALISFDQESIPKDLLISFAIQRDGVPFSAFFEAILMIFAFEILRETDYRVQNATGNTLSIVGALILGDAGVAAGIVSPIMIIVIAITMISGLMFADVNTVNALRSWRMTFLVLSGISGIYGIGIATMFFITKMCSLSSLNMPYTYPFAPINLDELKTDFITRNSVMNEDKRQKILTNNLTRLRIKK